MTIKLEIPEIADQPDPSVELRGVYVEEWLEALPYANPTAVLAKLIEAVSRLNSCPVKPAQRFALMELYVQPHVRLLEGRSSGPRHSIAAIEKHRSTSDATRRLAEELATGYKVVLAHSQSKRSLWGTPRDVAPSLQRAALFTSLALLHAYDQYLPAPPRLWTDLTTLYRFAAEADQHRTKVRSPVDDPLFTQTLEELYKRILLTSLVDPYHLRHGDVWRVYDAFGAVAGAADIGPVERATKPGGLFIMDPDVDQRPLPYAEAAEEASDRCLLLNANPVLERLRSATGSAASLAPAMIRALSLPPKRHSPRESTEGRIGIAAGMTAVHHLMGGRHPGGLGAPDRGDGGGVDLEVAVDEQDAVDSRFETESWDLTNEGPGGIGIVTHRRPGHAIGVGELVGVRQSMRGQSAESWSLAVIRWVSVGDDGDYRAGLQMVAKRARPVTVLIERADGGQRPSAAFAVPDLSSDKGSTLITSTGVFSSNGAITVHESGGSARRARPESLIEATGSFERFSYALE